MVAKLPTPGTPTPGSVSSPGEIVDKINELVDGGAGAGVNSVAAGAGVAVTGTASDPIVGTLNGVSAGPFTTITGITVVDGIVTALTGS